MGFSIIGSVSAGSTNATDITTGSLDTTGANGLIAVVSNYGPQGRPSITDSKGNYWRFVDEITANNGNAERLTIFDCGPTSVGTGHTFTVPPVNGTHYPSIAVLAVNFTAGFKPDLKSKASGGYNTTPLAPGSITPTADNALIVAAFGLSDTTNTASVDSGFTIDQQVALVSAQHVSVAVAHLIQGTAAAVNPSWSHAGNSWKCAIQIAYLDTATGVEDRVSQLGVELVSGGAGTINVSQLGVELLSAQGPALHTVTQLVVEVLTTPAATERVTQLVAETFTRKIGTTRVTQLVVETFTPSPPISGSSGIYFGDGFGGDIWID